mmetsp:Transcript_39443/g.92746  ORF Transcript_39443/g.92746 Transcript_39443/m.92746 type:complete len:298 (-) Transcript_39443:1489-2382(-)
MGDVPDFVDEDDADVWEGGGTAYKIEKVVGNGAFGIVWKARAVDTGEVVAIKKVLLDRRYQNRELQMMKVMDHDCVVRLKHYYEKPGRKKDETFLQIVMEYLPDTLRSVTLRYQKKTEALPHRAHQDVHVPDAQGNGVHSLASHLPPRHQARQPAGRPHDAAAQAVRLWLLQSAGQGAAQHLVHLLALLPRARAALWRDGVLVRAGPVEHRHHPGRAATGALAVPGAGLDAAAPRRDHEAARHALEPRPAGHGRHLHRRRPAEAQGLPVGPRLPARHAFRRDRPGEPAALLQSRDAP